MDHLYEVMLELTDGKGQEFAHRVAREVENGTIVPEDQRREKRERCNAVAAQSRCS